MSSNAASVGKLWATRSLLLHVSGLSITLIRGFRMREEEYNKFIKTLANELLDFVNNYTYNLFKNSSEDYRIAMSIPAIFMVFCVIVQPYISQSNSNRSNLMETLNEVLLNSLGIELGEKLIEQLKLKRVLH